MNETADRKDSPERAEQPGYAAGAERTERQYSYLGPAGTFTEAALKQVREAAGQRWKPTANVSEALQDVISGVSEAAMIAIENSVDGGVTVTQDALATTGELGIIGEYLVPVNFELVTLPGVSLNDSPVIAAHPVAYAQCRSWLEEHYPKHTHQAAGSNIQAVQLLRDPLSDATAAIGPLNVHKHHSVSVIAQSIADNSKAETRFVLVAKRRAVAEPTGHDKTSLIIELAEDRAGALLELLEQFATRGVNLTQIASRPNGNRLGSYRFYIDAEGHIKDERVADAVLGVKRHSPRVIFLGSYPRADKQPATSTAHNSNEAFQEARSWLRDLLSGS